MEIFSWELAYFSMEKKNLISQTMLTRHILPSDYIHKFPYFLQHRTKIRRQIADHQPFTVNSSACTLAVCHTLYCVAILFLAVHMHDALLTTVPILFSQCTSCFRKTMTLILFSTTNFEWLTEPKKKKKNHQTLLFCVHISQDLIHTSHTHCQLKSKISPRPHTLHAINVP